MTLSLRYGAGDLRWFDHLSREDQIALLGYERAEKRLRYEDEDPPPPQQHRRRR